MTIRAFLRRMAHATGTLDFTMAYITMFDDVTVSALPTGADYAYAGYTAGLYPTFDALKKKFPKARLLDIAVFASDNATCLDIENGDATIEEAPGWVDRQIKRGVYRPVLYIEASRMALLEATMTRAGFVRASYRLWTAHYLSKAHLCAPGACGYGTGQADGTQWTQTALGLNLDRSILLPDFFDMRPAPRPPKPVPPVPAIPAWQEAMMNSLPALQAGDTDEPGRVRYVRRVQSLVNLVGDLNDLPAARAVHVNGVFDDVTTAGVKAIQGFFGLLEDGVIGPKTWSALVTGSA